LTELELGDVASAEQWIKQLDPKILESGRATGIWPEAIGALRGIALQKRGDAAAARPLLEAALEAMKEEETLAQPGRLYAVTKSSHTRLP
jgi:hypothetical protein